MPELPPQYKRVFEDLAATVPALEVAYHRHLFGDMSVEKCSALAAAVVDIAQTQHLDLLKRFFDSLPPIYDIRDDDLSFWLQEGFMESLVFGLSGTKVPLAEVRMRMTGSARVAWDQAIDYIRPNSGEQAGA